MADNKVTDHGWAVYDEVNKLFTHDFSGSPVNVLTTLAYARIGPHVSAERCAKRLNNALGKWDATARGFTAQHYYKTGNLKVPRFIAVPVQLVALVAE